MDNMIKNLLIENGFVFSTVEVPKLLEPGTSTMYKVSHRETQWFVQASTEKEAFVQAANRFLELP